MQTVILSKMEEAYLRKTAEGLKDVFGIVIGQKTTDEKYYIVHLAKLSDDEESLGSSCQDIRLPFDNVNVQSLADQWINALKMTCGSFGVIGIFIAHQRDDLNDEKYTKDIIKILGELNRLVAHTNSTFGYMDSANENETIFLSYSTSSLNTNCKLFSNSEGKLISVDFKILDKLPQWYLFNTNYELEDVFPIIESKGQANIENQFNAALQAVKRNIYNSEIFIQHQNVDDAIILENYIKETGKKNDVVVFKASILLTANVPNEFLIKIRSVNGTIRFSGIVSSRVWCHSKNTFKEIKESIRKDVLRSLAARIQIYCDGLTDLHSNNGGILISEPPRRIYFCNFKCQGIQFSEYIFRGETPSVAVAQAKQILDMDINSECIFDDQEGLLDDVEAFVTEDPVDLNKKINSVYEISRSMFMLGIAAAFLVLLISVLCHYLFL